MVFAFGCKKTRYLKCFLASAWQKHWYTFSVQHVARSRFSMPQRQKHCKLLCFGVWQAPKNQQKSAKKCPKWTFQGKQQALFLSMLRSPKASKTQSEDE